MNLHTDHLEEYQGFTQTLTGPEGRLEGTGGFLLAAALNLWLALIEADTELEFDLPEERNPIAIKAWATEIIQSAAKRPRRPQPMRKKEASIITVDRRVRLYWQGREELGHITIEVWSQKELLPAVSVSVRWKAPTLAATKFQDLPEWFCGLKTFAEIAQFSGTLDDNVPMFACQHKGWEP